MNTSRITVLLVDDSVTDRTRAAGLIRKAHPDWDVVLADSAEQALQILATQSVDMVVSDLIMPEMDGRQLLTIMTADYPLTPVVLITAQGDDQVAADCIGQGAVHYVNKQQLVSDLVPVLEQVLLAETQTLETCHVLQQVVRNSLRFEIDSDLKQISSLIDFLRRRLHSMQIFSARKVRDISTAVKEALLNAHFHGRSQSAETSGAERIRLSMQLDQEAVTFQITDEGPGFDPTQILSTSSQTTQQRSITNGLQRMQALMDRVEFNSTGNQVTLIEYRRQ